MIFQNYATFSIKTSTMQKNIVIILLLSLLFSNCRTITEYTYPTDNFIKNSFSQSVTLYTYKKYGKNRFDSLKIKSDETALLISDKYNDTSGSSLINLEYDSIKIVFVDKKNRTYKKCIIKLPTGGTEHCPKNDNIPSLFIPEDNILEYNKKTRYNKYTYTITEKDYNAAE
jgi:hypothetical protein